MTPRTAYLPPLVVALVALVALAVIAGPLVAAACVIGTVGGIIGGRIGCAIAYRNER